MSEAYKIMANFLKNLSDSRRIEILYLLRGTEKHATEIQEALGKSQSSISRYLKVLQEEKLITVEKKENDNMKYYKIRDPYLFKIFSSLISFLVNINEDRMDALQDLSKKDI